MIFIDTTVYEYEIHDIYCHSTVYEYAIHDIYWHSTIIWIWNTVYDITWYLLTLYCIWICNTCYLLTLYCI